MILAVVGALARLVFVVAAWRSQNKRLRVYASILIVVELTFHITNAMELGLAVRALSGACFIAYPFALLLLVFRPWVVFGYLPFLGAVVVMAIDATSGPPGAARLGTLVSPLHWTAITCVLVALCPRMVRRAWDVVRYSVGRSVGEPVRLTEAEIVAFVFCLSDLATAPLIGQRMDGAPQYLVSLVIDPITFLVAAGYLLAAGPIQQRLRAVVLASVR